MSFALILQHADPWGPGRVVPVFRDFGIPCTLRRLHAGDALPNDLDEVRVVVVLGAGSSLSIGDVTENRQPWLADEVRFLQRVIAMDRPTLALGFGAQLLAHAAGAKVYPNAKPGATPEAPATPMPEYGWVPALFPFPGGTEPIVYGMSDGAPMFAWHSDTFDLPKLPAPANPAPPPAPPPPTGNALLSSTRTCKNQAFRFKTRLFGFQYHFELTMEEFEKIFADPKERETAAKFLGADAERKLRDDTVKNYARYARLGDRVVNNFVQYLKTY